MTHEAVAHSAPQGARLIYLVDADAQWGKTLGLQLHYLGYDVRGFLHPRDLTAALEKKAPDVLLMDMQFAEGPYAGSDAVGRLREAGRLNCPVVFTCSQDTFDGRLRAVRAGAVAFFTKPFDVVDLVDRLEMLHEIQESAPYKVQIIDDNASTAQLCAHILREAGMQPEVLTDPLRAIAAIGQFNPELILMDVYMPYCNGDELAGVIRQYPQFTSIPIVFLSRETNVNKQLAAMHHGGDDFLSKPIEPAHLVSSVTQRVARYRELRSLMVRDSLTGLLNHSRIEEELEMEVLRAERERVPLVFVMIDLDHFKQVNDRYGHAVGDRVLKSLAHLLKERLRRTDRIGRYGGEEFGVVLPGTTLEQARSVIDTVRQVFARITHRSDRGEPFHVTMSCGLAPHVAGTSAHELVKRADAALYEAKRTGRNRVVGRP